MLIFSREPKLRESTPANKKIWEQKVLNVKAAWTNFKQQNHVLTNMPTSAVIELTQNCNCRCYMCPHSADPKFFRRRPENEMKPQLFFKLAEQLFASTMSVDLRGFGETTILPYWNEVLEHLELYPFVNWYLVTNLSVRNNRMWQKMMKLGFELLFSCDGASKSTFETIRVGNKFDRILKNLKVLQEAKQTYQKGTVSFVSTMQKRNVHEMRSIVELAHQFDVDEVQFKMVQGEEWNLYQTDKNLIKEYVDAALDTALDLQIRISFNDDHFTRNVDPHKVEAAKLIELRRNESNFNVVDVNFWIENKMDYIYHDIRDTSRVAYNQRCFKPSKSRVNQSD